MKWYHKLGWFWIAFVSWLFIVVVLMHGCTPEYSAEAEESSLYDWIQRDCKYEIVHITHVHLSTGVEAINALAQKGWYVIDADWLKSGDVMQGFYTLERCE